MYVNKYFSSVGITPFIFPIFSDNKFHKGKKFVATLTLLFFTIIQFINSTDNVSYSFNNLNTFYIFHPTKG